MRRLTTLAEESRARTFGEVLESERIEYRIETLDEGAEVWVLRDDQLDAARDLLDAWTADPTDLRFQQAQAAVAMRRKAKAAELARLRDGQARLDRAQRPVRPGPVTIGTILVAAVITWFGIGSVTELGNALVSLPDAETARLFYIDDPVIATGPDGACVPFLHSIRQGEVWRLFTPAFMHSGGLFHLFFNAYWFYFLGQQIETRKGSLYLLLGVLASGVVSMLGQYVCGWLLTDPSAWLAGNMPDYGLFGRIYLGGMVGGGLSGVLYGLFGYILAKSYVDKFSGLGVPSSTVALLLIWLLVCFAGQPVEVPQTGQTLTMGVAGNIANLAHLTGLLSGVLWGLVSHRIRPRW